MTFKYDAGQTVEYRPMGGTVGLYTVVRQMPEEDGATDLKYRIKNTMEGFERNVMESDLTATDNPDESMYSTKPMRRGLGGHR